MRLSEALPILKRPRGLLAAWAFLLLVPVVAAAHDCTGGNNYDGSAHVAYVYDGDTVRLDDGRHIRLIGVDTPEIAHDGHPAEPFALAARQFLIDLLHRSGGNVRLRYGPERKDHYHRTLAHLYLPDGQSVEAALLKRGLGTALAVAPNLTRAQCYRRLEARADRGGRGIWALRRYHWVASGEVPSERRGFARVYGTVDHVGHGGGARWLDLRGGIGVRVPERDLHYFQGVDLDSLQGRVVGVRGWLYRRHGELRLTLHHPIDLTIGSPIGGGDAR